MLRYPALAAKTTFEEPSSSQPSDKTQNMRRKKLFNMAPLSFNSQRRKRLYGEGGLFGGVGRCVAGRGIPGAPQVTDATLTFF